jgi:hypothetical protein
MRITDWFIRNKIFAIAARLPCPRFALSRKSSILKKGGRGWPAATKIFFAHDSCDIVLRRALKILNQSTLVLRVVFMLRFGEEIYLRRLKYL